MAKLFMKNQGKYHRRETHPHCVEKERSNVRESVLDHYKSSAPNERDQDQEDVSFEGAGHVGRVAEVELAKRALTFK
jgi:hypothetical protein